jgi:hypothetical protein
MKKILWTLLFFLMFNIAFSLDLENVRINYEKAVRMKKFVEVF